MASRAFLPSSNGLSVSGTFSFPETPNRSEGCGAAVDGCASSGEGEEGGGARFGVRRPDADLREDASFLVFVDVDEDDEFSPPPDDIRVTTERDDDDDDNDDDD